MLRGIYSSLLYALSPAVSLWLRQSSRRRGGPRYFRERRGRYSATAAPGEAPLWLHCASVGEVRTAAPLVHALCERRPEIPLLITTATASGAETARRVLPEPARHVYQPVDWPGAVGRFLRTFRPRMAVVLETEIWPNLYHATARRGIPLLLANARLSQRTVEGAALVRRLQSAALTHVHEVLARTQQDAERFAALGVPEARIRVLGSLKLAPPPGTEPEPIELGRPFLLAASTHDDEEQRIAAAWHEARSDRRVPQLLVLVPRHPERGAAIRATLERSGFRVALRSAGDDPRRAEIYVADTLGELEGFMAAATLVVIGGSLIRHGGQNPIEPARLARPILLGPSMENFAEESERLLAAGGAQRFLDDGDLRHAISELARDPEARERLGQRAAETVRAGQDTAERYADAILAHLPAPEEAGR